MPEFTDSPALGPPGRRFQNGILKPSGLQAASRQVRSAPGGTSGSNPLPSSAESAANFVFGREAWKGPRTTRDDPHGEYLMRNRWFDSGSLQRRVRSELLPVGIVTRILLSGILKIRVASA